MSRALVVRQKKSAGHVCYLCEGRKYVVGLVTWAIHPGIRLVTWTMLRVTDVF